LSYSYSGVGSTYVSSGSITLNGAPFIQGVNEVYTPTQNTIQPVQSTLQFNSTLFVNRNTSRVGINTATPNFDLDAKRILNNETMYGGVSSLINTQVSITPFLSTYFYAFIDANISYSSNIVYSSNLTNWSLGARITNSIDTPIYTTYYSPGLSRSMYESLFFPESLLPQFFLGTRTISFGESNQYWATIGISDYFFGAYGIQPVTLNGSGSNPPDTMRSMATDGFTYIAVATANASSNIYGSKIWYSQNDPLNWYDIVEPIFLPSFAGRSNGAYDIVYGGMKTPVWIAVGAGSNATAYKSTDIFNWSPLTTNVDELRAIITFQLPTGGTTVFLATGGFLNSVNTISDGLVISSSNEGSLWTSSSPYLFSGSGICLATDGAKIVVGGEDISGNTLWYSYINDSNTYTWSVCQGSLFSERTNSVIWNGSTWLAAGNDGLRESVDGITWGIQPSLTAEVYNLGYTSNAAITMGVGDSNISNNLYFQESPSLQCQALISAGTVSFYPSSILNLNNACILDANQNMIVPGFVTSVSPLVSTSFTSTFYTPTAYISSFLSTNQVQVGGYYLGIESV
jgi:hypothetical protein